MKTTFPLLEFLLLPSVIFSDPLYDHLQHMGLQQSVLWREKIDFNGDGFDDLFVYHPYDPLVGRKIQLNKEWPHDRSRYFDARGAGIWVVNTSMKIETGFIYDVIPAKSQSDAREGLLMLYQNELYFVRYYNYECSVSLARDIFSYRLYLDESTNIVDAEIGNYIGNDDTLDLIVIASNGVNNQILIFASPFETYYSAVHPDERSDYSELFPSYLSYFPRLDSSIFTIDGDHTGNDTLFFQSENQWHFWTFPDSAAIVSDTAIEKISVDISSEIIRPLDVVATDFSKYKVLISVASEAESDLVFIAYPTLDDSEMRMDFLHPTHVRIQNKSDINTVSRLLRYEDLRNSISFPILVMNGNQIEDSQASHEIFIYRIHETTIENPELVQVEILDESRLIRPSNPLESVDLFQFDTDGITDLLLYDGKMIYYCLPSLSPSSAVNKQDWDLYD